MGSNYVSGLGYNWAGQVTGRTLGGDIVESFGYSSTRQQLTSQTVTQNGFTRLSLSYAYQASAGQMGAGSTAGNADQLMSVTGSINGATENASYTYDLQRRLVTSSQLVFGTPVERRFVYDRWGNRTAMWNAVSGGTLFQAVTLEQPGGIPTNRFVSVTTNSVQANYSYDAAGNVTSDFSHTYVYDGENRLVSVDGGIAQYIYDHQNRRIRKWYGATPTHYVWEGYQVLAEHNGSTGAVLIDYVYHGGQMIAKEESGNRKFFLHDRLSVRAVITDGQGGIQGVQAHLPFGEEVGTSGEQEKHRFTSYERDAESASDFAVNRQYSSPVGRFMSADPYRASGYVVDPQSWNQYSYARNDPANRIDLLGLKDIRIENPSGMPIPGNGYGAFGPGSYGQLLDDGALSPSPKPKLFPGRLQVQSSCAEHVYYIAEANTESDPRKAYQPAPKEKQVEADAVVTERGAIKLTDFCSCTVECDGDKDYEIHCTCVQFGITRPFDPASKEFPNFRDVREFAWMDSRDPYMVEEVVAPEGISRTYVYE